MKQLSLFIITGLLLSVRQQLHMAVVAWVLQKQLKLQRIQKAVIAMLTI